MDSKAVFRVKEVTERNDAGKTITSPPVCNTMTFKNENLTFFDTFRLLFVFSIPFNERRWHSSWVLSLPLAKKPSQRKNWPLFYLEHRFCDYPHWILFDSTSCMWRSWESVTFHWSSRRHEVIGRNHRWTEDFGRQFRAENNQSTHYGSAKRMQR